MNTTSAVFVPHTGVVTTLPPTFDVSTIQDATTPITDGTNLGLIGEDGITISNLRGSTDPIRVFNNRAVVKRVAAEFDGVSIEVPLAELTDATDRVYFGKVGDSANGGRIDITPETTISAPVCIDMITKSHGGVSGNGVVIERWILPNASISEVGDVEYTYGELSVRSVTFLGDTDPETGVAGHYWRTVVSPDTTTPEVPEEDGEGF